MVVEKNDILLGEMLIVKSISKPGSSSASNIVQSKPKKGKNEPKLMKSSLKSRLWQSADFGPKPNRHEPKIVKKKNSIVSFVDNLNQIAKKTEQLDVIGEANEEIDIAFKQLEELKKLLTRKIRQQAINVLKCNQFEGGDDDESGTRNARLSPKPSSSCAKIAKLKSNFEKLKKDFGRKPQIHFKSLKDFEQVSLFANDDATSEINKHEISEKPPSTSTRPDPIITSTIEKPIERVLYKNATRFPYIDSDTEIDESSDEIDSEPHKTESATQVESPRVDKYGQLIAYAFTDAPKVQAYKSIFNRNNKQLEKSIIKSDYLLKEFSIDDESTKSFPVDIKVQKNAQLFQTPIRKKFQDARQTFEAANFNLRDRKLYSTLNLSLKNSLYTTIEEIKETT